jgi:hypothetical protein
MKEATNHWEVMRIVEFIYRAAEFFLQQDSVAGCKILWMEPRKMRRNSSVVCLLGFSAM